MSKLPEETVLPIDLSEFNFETVKEKVNQLMLDMASSRIAQRVGTEIDYLRDKAAWCEPKAPTIAFDDNFKFNHDLEKYETIPLLYTLI